MTYKTDAEKRLTTGLEASDDQAGNVSNFLLLTPWKRHKRGLVSGETAHDFARRPRAANRCFPFFLTKKGLVTAVLLRFQHTCQSGTGFNLKTKLVFHFFISSFVVSAPSSIACASVFTARSIFSGV
jgi:hypothetical protein